MRRLPLVRFVASKRVRYVVVVFVAVTGLTLLLSLNFGVASGTSADERVNRLMWATAVALGVWVTFVLFVVDSTLFQINEKLQEAKAAMENRPPFALPFPMMTPALRPVRTPAEEWTQPTKEDHDRLVEGTQLDGDGEERPIVLLVKANGDVHGYSGPLDGVGLAMTLEIGGPEMPPDPDDG